MKTKGFIIFIITLFLFTQTSCKKEVVFKAGKTEITLGVKEEYIPNLIIENIKKYELEYICSSDILKIENGVIHCLSEGKCDVIISIKDRNDIIPIILNITVVNKVPSKIICDKEVEVIINQTYKLNPNLSPTTAVTTLLYSSNDTSIVTVDENGLIKGVSEGETHVVIKSKEYPNVSLRVLVRVRKPPVEKIEAVDNLTLDYNETYQLEWDVLPDIADKTVRFESSDESIVSVDENGLVTAYKYGKATVKIISFENELIYKEINISVEGDKATNIVIENEKIDLKLGDTYEIHYSVLPQTAYQGLEIIIDNESMELNENVVLFKKNGTYEVLLKTVDDTNIEKKIIFNITSDEKPIFVTNSLFDEQSNLAWNEKFDPLDNIRAFDDKDGEITNKITVNGEVNNQLYGEYVLEYTIEDSDGNIERLTRVINVEWGYSVTVIGHAGSYFGVPNSEEAILYAAKVLKYPAIEIDLKQTKDGVFVLSHDPDWGGVSLEDTNYEDLKTVKYTVVKNQGLVDVKLTEEERTFTATICTFERYLEICKEYQITAIIELKTSKGISNWTEANTPNASRMKDIMALIEKYDMLNQVVFLSSQELCLNWVKKNGYEYIPCQYLTLSSCANINTYNIVKKYGLDISFNVRDGIKISDEWLKLYRDLGCKLAVFTFEEYASYSDIQYWIDRGVDYVTTDWHSLEKLELPKSNN